MKKIAVFTSGGDAPGMNACVRAVVRTCISKGIEVIGIVRGYEGMIEGDFIEMGPRTVSNIVQRGGTILKSARSDRFRTKEGRATAYKNIKELGVDAMVAIGGDGTFTGATVFMSEYPDIKIVGAPGTIDNDLYGTDFTIGYDTAINTAMEAIDKIKDTAASHDRLFFVEVMGRSAGFIAMEVGIATGAEAILVPESETEFDKLVERLKAKYDKQQSSIVVVAEGDEEGGAIQVAQKVKERFDKFDTRVSILGHMQRGGTPTCRERVMASRMGLQCVEALLAGESGVMVGLVDNKMVYTQFADAISRHPVMNPNLFSIAETLAI